MPGLQVRWRGLRRRGTFPDPQRDLPQWEAQILDALSSLAVVSAERWVIAGPVSGSSSAAIVSAAGALQPGWLLRVAPTGLVTDIPLPDLGREGTGRMIAVQHTGARQSVIRLGWAGAYVAAATDVGELASAIWDGTAWVAFTGGVRELHVNTDSPLIIANWDTPGTGLVDSNAGAWGHALNFPNNGVSSVAGTYYIPRNWIGTDMEIDLHVTPRVSGTGNAIFAADWSFAAHNGTAPAWALTFAVSPPATGSQLSNTLALAPADLGMIREVGFAGRLLTPIGLMSEMGLTLFLNILRRADLAGDTFAPGGVGAAEITLVHHAIKIQVAS